MADLSPPVSARRRFASDPRPYVWTKTADQILESIKRYCTRINDSRDWVLRFSASRQHQLTV
jgi:hypothetical protein